MVLVEAQERKKLVLKKLEELGKKIIEAVKKGENPAIELTIRGSRNIVWDENLGLLALGEKKARRYFINVAHARKFMQTLLVAAFVKQLLEENIHASLREAFYNLKHTIGNTKENTFDEQRESDAIFVDLEVALDVLRDELNINADRRGVAVGDVVIEDRGDEIDWSKLGSGGWAIPGNVEDIKFKEINADYVLVVEKNATFDRLHEDKFWKKNSCILIGTQGQAARGIRRLIHRLNHEFNLPVYVFTDADPYGWYIYSVIKIGSMNLAHISPKLATPKARFIGLTITDIDRYGLKNAIIKAKDVDIKRANELLNYPWFQAKPWQREIKEMIRRRIKAEQEALAQRYLRFVSKEYLPEKISSGAFLP